MRRLCLYLTIIMVCFIPQAWAKVPFAPSHTDVRFLIDESGMMAADDPGHMRDAAMVLFIHLLPGGDRSSLYRFGQYANSIVPLSIASAEKTLDETATGQIALHSHGVVTHLHQGIEMALGGWEKVDPNTQRALVILSDGFVDFESDAAAARMRHLDSLIAHLRQQGVAVHTIARSQSADEVLLKRLAQETNGTYQAAGSPQTLPRRFLAVFNDTVSYDSVPIHDGHFFIDDSISKMTVLAFHKPGDSVTLRTPQGHLLTHASILNGVKWYQTPTYDVIKLTHPVVGHWQLQGSSDKQNLVRVDSRIHLDVQPSPNHIFWSDHFKHQVRILQNGKPLTDSRLLDKIKIRLHDWTANSPEKVWALHPSGAGLYADHAELQDERGQQQLQIEALSDGFERTHRQVITVHDNPVLIKIEPEAVAGNHRIRIIPKRQLVAVETLRIDVEATDAEGEARDFQLQWDGDTGQWFLTLPTIPVRDFYMVALRIRGKSAQGHPFKTDLAPIVVRPFSRGTKTGLLS